jgi:glucan phosphoethanolaminetransferase (alkaline phosphatase superfamily)
MSTLHHDRPHRGFPFLQDAVADANLTFWSVPIILTGITPEQLTTAPIRGNIVDLAKEAGYSTTHVGIHADHMTFPTSSMRSRWTAHSCRPFTRQQLGRD